MKLWCFLLLFPGIAVAGPACLPAPFPASENYLGGFVRFDATASHRYAWWACYSRKEALPDKVVWIAGPKTLLPSTIAGRLYTIEKSATPQTAADRAWTRYVTLTPESPEFAPVALEIRKNIGLIAPTEP
jgi:hypothetical protein